MKALRLALLSLALALPGEAAVFTVTRTADTLDGACDHDCSLREAIDAANDRDGLDFVLAGPGTYLLTRPGAGDNAGATGDLDVRDDLVILGAGADRTVFDAGGLDRILDGVFIDTRLEVHGVTLRNGRVQGADGSGGGIRTGGTLVLRDSVVTGNHAELEGGGIAALELIVRDSAIAGNTARSGGGLFVSGRLVLVNATVSGNRAALHGGGLFLWSMHTEIRQATVTGNTAGSGGGLALDFSEVFCPGFCDERFLLSLSVVANNSAASGPDCLNLPTPNLGGSNVFGVGATCNPGPTDLSGTSASPLDPRLTTLGDHGGTTPTHALLPESPAVDLAPASGCTAADQRGLPRAMDGDRDGAAACDAGAFEGSPACEPSDEALCLGEAGRFRASVRWTAQGASAPGRPVPLTSDTGAFWFFDPANLEMEVKVLDGCGVNQRFWIFLSGLTDVGVDVTVEDTATGETWEHHHPAGSPLPTVLDTGALAVCGAAGPAVAGGTVPDPEAGSVFRVTKTDDTLDGHCDHDCSLREAVYASNLHLGPDVVVVGSGVYTLARLGADEDTSITGDLDVLGSGLVILGAGAESTVLDGGGTDRVLDVWLGASLELRGVTLRNGSAQTPGGGIRAHGPVRLEGCVVTGNRARTFGGGISANDLTAVDTTISDNTVDEFGGGISGGPRLHLTRVTISGNRARIGGGVDVLEGDVEIMESTLTGNAAAQSGGGLALDHLSCIPEDPCPPSRFSLSRSILAANSAPRAPDCVDLFDNAGGHNLFGAGERCHPGPTDRAGTTAAPLDPRLGPLADNGGPTPTHLPLPGSPAIDSAGGSCSAADQRGANRPADGDGNGTPRCDAGAVEAAPGCLPGPTRLCLQDGRFAVTVRWATQGTSGPGRTVPLTADTGAFWFFDAANVEMTVKVLDGCGLNGRFWVFLSGLTDVEVEVTVVDTQTGETWIHHHAAGTPLHPRLDTGALECVNL